jgi:hypothetical protein
MSTKTKSIAAKITKGEWKAKRLRDNGGAPYATLYEAHIDLGVCMVWAPEGNEEQEANAELIAEAGTVANETGMTPRELVDKLREAVKLVERSRDEALGATFFQDRQDFLSTLTLPADEH